MWIRNGWVEPIDWDDVPNRANIEDDYDPGGRFLLPYQAGATLDQKLGAIEEVGRIAAKGQFRRCTGNDYTQDLAKANAWAAMAKVTGG